jgi:rubrerythrin
MAKKRKARNWHKEISEKRSKSDRRLVLICRDCGHKDRGYRFQTRRPAPQRCSACGGMLDSSIDLERLKNAANQPGS